MKWLISFLIIGFFLLSVLPSASFIRAKAAVANGFSIQASGTTPTILYAEWLGKNLQIEGTNFADGVSIFVDGQKMKSVPDPVYPNYFLMAKKAKRKVAPEQVIKLQVQNPNGEMSNEFAFYSGFIITRSYYGSTINLKVGDKFLLFLPPKGEPPSLEWSVGFVGFDQTLLTRITDNLPIPHTQGFFQAVRPGQVGINAQGRYLCPPFPPEFCGPLGYYIGFDLGVRVE